MSQSLTPPMNHFITTSPYQTSPRRFKIVKMTISARGDTCAEDGINNEFLLLILNRSPEANQIFETQHCFYNA